VCARELLRIDRLRWRAHGGRGPSGRATNGTGRAVGFPRTFDLLAAGALLVLGAPILALAALAIRLDSPGPVLFRQARIGQGGRPFEMLKLRTMRAGASSDPHREHVRALLQAADGASDTRRPWAGLASDPRVTRVGRLLRTSGLDELPQLINVLCGEMRLVGPRPALPYEVELWSDWHFRRLAVPPGITGLWQVDGRDRSTFDEMVHLDLAYIATRSLTLDLAILARTPRALLRRPSAAASSSASYHPCHP